MKQNKIYKRSFILTIALTAVFALTAVLPCAAQYSAIDLQQSQQPSTSVWGEAHAINASGQIAGMWRNVSDSNQNLFIWLPEAAYGLQQGFNDLGMVNMTDSITGVNAINASGQIVGSYATPDYHTRSFIYLPVAAYGLQAGFHDLGTSSSIYPFSAWINDAGQVVLDLYNGSYFNSSYIWTNGILKSFTADYNLSINVRGINNQGQVLGRVPYGINDWEFCSEILQIDSEGNITSTTDVNCGRGALPYFINNSGDVLFNGSVGDVGGYYLWDHTANAFTKVDVRTQFSGDSIVFAGLNDDGQVLGTAEPETSDYFVPWVWQAGTFTSGPTQQGHSLNYLYMSGSHLVGTGIIQAEMQQYGFHWSIGAPNVDILQGTNPFVRAVNNEGQVAGIDYTSGPSHAALWTPSQSSLTVSGATVTARNSKAFTVTVEITNPSTSSTAYNVGVTAASLDGSYTNSVLPLVYGAIKPGESKKCTLQFKTVPSGPQTLTVNGTCSLGDFSTTQTLTVP